MTGFNDDGVPLDLTTVLVLFLMPNFAFILLTAFIPFLVHVSKKHPQLNKVLGGLSNFFAKGALDRIIRNMLQHFEIKKCGPDEQISMSQRNSFRKRKDSKSASRKSTTSTFNFTFEKQYDKNYLLLVPFQIDLLLTIFIYTILTRDVYPETCESYLTTYHSRPTQVVCWLKHINRNISNLSTNITLYQYCTNQTITYHNYEHNDVICTQYVFRLINIIDTVTNLFAWHQAIVFIVTKSIVFSYWYQHKLRRASCWSNLFACQRRSLLFIIICSSLLLYVIPFVLVLPIRFYIVERRRVDLTHHLIYACSKFIAAIIVHVNLYTLYQRYSAVLHKYPLLTVTEEKKVKYDQQSEPSLSNRSNEYLSSPGVMTKEKNFSFAPNTSLTTTLSS